MDTYYCLHCDREYDRYDHSHDKCKPTSTSECARCGEPATSPWPKMSEVWFVKADRLVSCAGHGVSLAELRALLATQGLHVIDAKQKEVLAACDALDIDSVMHIADGPQELDRLATALLARREGAL